MLMPTPPPKNFSELMDAGRSLPSARIAHIYGFENIGTRMKTTMEINDALLAEARKTAASTNTSLRDVFEMALRQFLEERRKHEREPFRLSRKTFKGRGLQTGLEEGDWGAMRERAYEDHGG
ncbi:MAG: hypothetical protein ACR2RB_20710 [Gammaproteobacteria bacterium]